MQRRYVNAIIRRMNSRRDYQIVPQQEDWFSERLAWLVHRPLILFGTILICLLALSIACDHVLAVAEARVPDVATSIQPDLEPMQVIASADPAGLQARSDTGSSFFDLFATEQNGNLSGDWSERVRTLLFRLTLAALLGALVAFRPRRSSSLRHRNPYVVQTQILLAVVACALMMIVGDSAARAFGIFAAASLVRFRTNIRDPKETTVLLITLGVGLAAGVGRWELATMFALFVMVLLQILEGYEHHQAVRFMELSVKTHDVEATDEAVRAMFRRNHLDIDVKEINKESEKRPLGKVVYSVDISRGLDTDQLAEEISLADPINIERIEWHRKKAASYA